MAAWRRAFQLHLRRGTVEQDVRDEIAFHLDQAARELMADGLEPQAARTAYLRATTSSLRPSGSRRYAA